MRRASDPRGTSAASAPGPTGVPAAVPGWFDPRGPFLVPLVLLLLTRGVAWAMLPHASEDAYITFRYARSLAAGHGLVFNPGERVMGFTSPLWTLWNALGIALVRDPIPWARAWSVAADAATLLVVTRLLARHASVLSAWAFAFVFAVWPYGAVLSASGMENGVLVALAAVAAAATAARAGIAGPALAALALCRPEGLVMAAWIALWAGWRARLAALALTAAGVAALTAYYGSPLPRSLFSKATLYGTPGPWEGRHWWEWVSPFTFGRWPVVMDLNSLFPLAVVIAPAMVAGLRLLWSARRTALAAFVGAGAAVWLGYAAIGAAYFWWYAAVPIVTALALAAAGLPRIVRGPALAISCALFAAGAWTFLPVLYLGRARAEVESFGGAAEFLRGAARPGDQALLEPIGLIGWRAPVRVLDEVGLVTPAIAARRTHGPGWYADVVADRRPEWLVVRRGVLETGSAFAGRGAPFRDAAERDRLLERYRLVHPPGPAGGPADLLILRRAD